MNQYETVIIYTPVLPEEKVKEGLKGYVDFMKENGATMVNEDFWGLKQLAYPIQKKTTGFYMVYEYQAPGDMNAKMDVKFRRDANVLRYVTIKLDKHGVEYNDMKRKGLIGKRVVEAETTEEGATS